MKEMDLLSPTYGLKSIGKASTLGKCQEIELYISWTVDL
jgi:hypothetical protein